jgi:hypothetical protein
MMFRFTHLAARAAIAAATLIGTIVLASPLFAASGDLSQAAATKSPAAREILAEETRIKELHKKLHITAAQETPWNNLAQVMRDNAKAMVDLEKQRAADTQSMSAVDVVKSWASVIEAHEAGMKKFVPAFEALYNSMSDAQKKTADSLFRSRARAAVKKESN